MYMKKWIMICACVAVFQTALAQRITRQYNLECVVLCSVEGFERPPA